MKDKSMFARLPRSRFFWRVGLLIAASVAATVCVAVIVPDGRSLTEQIAERVKGLGGSIMYEAEFAKMEAKESANSGIPLPSDHRVPEMELTKRIRSISNLRWSQLSTSDMRLIGKAKEIKWLGLVMDAEGEHVDCDALFLSLPSLPNLKGLDLTRARISDRSLAHLANFPKLENLGLTQESDVEGESWITDAGLEHLKHLEKLESLGLEGTQVTGANFPLAPRLPHLREVNVSDSKWTDEGVKRLATHDSLEEINLAYTDVTDACLESLSGLKALQELKLGFTQVTVAGLRKVLPKMKSLQELEVSVEGMDAEALKELQKLAPACKIAG